MAAPLTFLVNSSFPEPPLLAQLYQAFQIAPVDVNLVLNTLSAATPSDPTDVQLDILRSRGDSLSLASSFDAYDAVLGTSKVYKSPLLKNTLDALIANKFFHPALEFQRVSSEEERDILDFVFPLDPNRPSDPAPPTLGGTDCPWWSSVYHTGEDGALYVDATCLKESEGRFMPGEKVIANQALVNSAAIDRLRELGRADHFEENIHGPLTSLNSLKGLLNLLSANDGLKFYHHYPAVPGGPLTGWGVGLTLKNPEYKTVDDTKETTELLKKKTTPSVEDEEVTDSEDAKEEQFNVTTLSEAIKNPRLLSKAGVAALTYIHKALQKTVGGKAENGLQVLTRIVSNYPELLPEIASGSEGYEKVQRALQRLHSDLNPRASVMSINMQLRSTASLDPRLLLSQIILPIALQQEQFLQAETRPTFIRQAIAGTNNFTHARNVSTDLLEAISDDSVAWPKPFEPSAPLRWDYRSIPEDLQIKLVSGGDQDDLQSPTRFLEGIQHQILRGAISMESFKTDIPFFTRTLIIDPLASVDWLITAKIMEDQPPGTDLVILLAPNPAATEAERKKAEKIAEAFFSISNNTDTEKLKRETRRGLVKRLSQEVALPKDFARSKRMESVAGMGRRLFDLMATHGPGRQNGEWMMFINGLPLTYERQLDSVPQILKRATKVAETEGMEVVLGLFSSLSGVRMAQPLLEESPSGIMRMLDRSVNSRQKKSRSASEARRSPFLTGEEKALVRRHLKKSVMISPTLHDSLLRSSTISFCPFDFSQSMDRLVFAKLPPATPVSISPYHSHLKSWKHALPVIVSVPSGSNYTDYTGVHSPLALEVYENAASGELSSERASIGKVSSGEAFSVNVGGMILDNLRAWEDVKRAISCLSQVQFSLIRSSIAKCETMIFEHRRLPGLCPQLALSDESLSRQTVNVWLNAHNEKAVGGSKGGLHTEQSPIIQNLFDLSSLRPLRLLVQKEDEDPLVTIQLILDPLSTWAQRILPLVSYLHEYLDAKVQILLNPAPSYASLPLARWYTQVLSPPVLRQVSQMEEDRAFRGQTPTTESQEQPVDGQTQSAEKQARQEDMTGLAARFSRLHPTETLTANVDVPSSWKIVSLESNLDLDNIRSVDLSSLMTNGTYVVQYRVEGLYLETAALGWFGANVTKGSRTDLTGSLTELSQSTEVLTDIRVQISKPTWRLESQAESRDRQVPRETIYSDTLVTRRPSYMQLKVPGPGLYRMSLLKRTGSIEVKIGKEKALAPMGLSLMSENNQQWTVTEKNGMNYDLWAVDDAELNSHPYHLNVLASPLSDEKPTRKGWTQFWVRGKNVEDATALSFPQSEALYDQNQSPLLNRNDTIHIFTLASGFMYERLLKIMILSVKKNTKKPVCFWILKNFLSAQFFKDIRTLQDLYPTSESDGGLEIRFVDYKWPGFVREQNDKQRKIWGYKILFLDVLFPLSVQKIIYIDSDQVVRHDVSALWDMDLQGKVYGYVPFCRDGDEREDTLGVRFWEEGYWKQHLKGLPYHISALYVVDLKLFREKEIGGLIRHTYNSLSSDPNSLSNLDQDLPNFMQHTVPIFSLPSEWLWCETWCNDESKQRAKTIDLCNNPLTKEPKLSQARRIIPEWTSYDEEIRTAIEGGKPRASDGSSAEKMAIPRTDSESEMTETDHSRDEL